MKKCINCISICYNDEKQTKWWNKVGSKLVRYEHVRDVFDNDTKELVGSIFAVYGLFKHFVIRKCTKIHTKWLCNMYHKD